MDYHRFIQATLQLEQVAEAKRQAKATAEQNAVDAIKCGDHPRAVAAIEILLAQNSNVMRWWHELALIRTHGGDKAAALAAWQQALCCDVEDLPLLQRIGQSLSAAGHDPTSIAIQVWAQRSTDQTVSEPAPHLLLEPAELRTACLDVLRNEWAKALPVFKKIKQSQPTSLQATQNLAFLLDHLDRHGQAQCALAANWLARGHPHQAAEVFESAPETDSQASEFLPTFLSALRLSGKELRAIQVAATAEKRGSCPPSAYKQWAEALGDMHRYEEAIEILQQGAATLGDESCKLLANLMLPPVPVSQRASQQAHQRVCQAIHLLSESPLPKNPETLAMIADYIGPNFYLAYLGTPCVDEARAYGLYARRIMQSRFPLYDKPLLPRRRSSGARIRIGYATSFANHHVVMKCFGGWLQHADRREFELHLFPLATELDRATGYLASLVDTCHASVTETEAAARQIRESNLDLLVYPEVGMDSLSFRLAAMRLAPVQCVAGGHPITSGLDTLDYFLSVAAAEPANAAEHYTERLVTLPGISICVPNPTLPAEHKSRAEFGLTPDDVVYLSPQSLFKYLPRYDETFARIAQSVDAAVLVFVEGKYPAWTRTFTDRLQRTFKAHGLCPDRHLRFIPRQSYDSFLCLNAISDIFLDPLGSWSGMTALDALACGLPIVTLPGSVMRTRESFALLTLLGITDTIAANQEDYLRLAIDLGKDADRRAEISQRIQNRSHLLFDDVHCVKALEAFFRWATGSAQPSDETLFSLRPEPSCA